MCGCSRQANAGRAAARNAGLRQARGEFIGFVDADDTAEARMYELLLACADRTGADLIVGEYVGVDARTDEVLYHYPEGDGALYGCNVAERPELLLQPGASVCNKLFRKTLFTTTGISFPEGRDFEDLATAYRLTGEASRIEKVSEVVYHYRQGLPSSIMAACDERYLEIVPALVVTNEHFIERGRFDELRGQLEAINFIHLIGGRLDDVLRFGNGRLRGQFLDAAFAHMDGYFPGWRRSPAVRAVAGRLRAALGHDEPPTAWRVHSRERKGAAMNTLDKTQHASPAIAPERNKRSLRVVQVSTSDTGGGAERIAADLHVASLARGMKSTLAVGHRFGDIERTVLIPNDARRSAWTRAWLRLAPDSASIFASRGSASRLWRRAVKSIAEPDRAVRRLGGYEDFAYPGTPAIPVLGGGRADVLHLHNLHGGYFDLRCLPSLTVSTPTVLTAHDTWLASGHCAYAIDCQRWLEGCGDCPTLWTPPSISRDRSAENLRLKRKIYQASRVHLVGPSKWVLSELERSAFAEAVIDVHHIPNGVDQHVFRPAPSGIAAAKAALGVPSGALVIVFSAANQASPYKDFATIEAALPRIVESVANHSLVLFALGGLPAGQTVPGARVVSVPYSPDPRHVAAHLQAADLAVHMARAENHPLAILEAQSCGVPVVASRVGGIPETLVDGATGLLVDPGDITGLAQAASALLVDDTRRRTMSAEAQAYASRYFGLDRMVDEYVALYERLSVS